MLELHNSLLYAAARTNYSSIFFVVFGKFIFFEYHKYTNHFFSINNFFLKREKGKHTHKGMWAAPIAKLDATSCPTAHFVDGDIGLGY
jgi:hypothetical protein